MDNQNSYNDLHLGSLWFWGKIFGEKLALHLKSALEDKFKVTINWEGKLYIGIALKWDNEKVMVQL